ncbi:hypothetical protein S7711_10029 [Stachybotrys chartarum IBT 7711]|uniref:Uncharacterized protein n=1 Tax=Stachybotrys chartarum (strain CBS 109288 / IBT 7711) TaxID=1280523 RepID=A0A084B527_STACB|nr:hypothetical protein S7711_10029 [Stachybotrys chartarum IBT 7711]
MQDNRDLWVGINHNTCNSAAVCDGQIIQYQHGCPTIPTIVRYNEGQFSLANGPADPGDFDMKFYKRVLRRASEVKTIPEPIAAVLHLLHTASAVDSEFILVVDRGAGTWDLSAITIGRANGKQRFTVKATAGNNHLGGLDVDQALRDIVLKQAGRRVSTPSSLSNLLSKCEGAKIRISQQALAEPSIPVIYDDGTRVVVKLTHEDFDQACSVLRHGVEDLFKEIFRRDATIMERIETIALNSGSSYLPCIRALCQSYLPNIPIIQRDGDTAVAFGASLFGSDSSIEVMDVLPKSISVLTHDNKTDKLQVIHTQREL